MSDKAKIKFVTYEYDDVITVFATKGDITTEFKLSIDLTGYADLDALESVISKAKQSLVGKG
jgi:hypothetical protein